ncbi:pfs domain protein [Rutstroemia sp. NJR-2017a BVV2]|nr:pfs domain protein [Rutstroemia sp. NJR-2017a BVV2]
MTTSGDVDIAYSSTDPYKAIPRSEAPQAGASRAVSSYPSAYPPAGSSYNSAPTNPYDNLGKGLQRLSLEPVASSTGNELGNNEYAPTDVVPGAPPNRHITKASDGADKEVLDPRYCRVGYEFWKVGRVFMMLWTEPAGVNAQRGGTRNHSHISETWLSGKAYSEIRRFVVVRDNYGNCSCLAIHTYSGWATLKPNLPDPDNHAIIYTTKLPPAPYSYKDDIKGLVSESLLKDPIRVNSECTDKEGSLDAKSRINYTKTYTVEKDVRVLNIGSVDKRSMNALLASSPFKQSFPSSSRRRMHQQSGSQMSSQTSTQYRSTGSNYYNAKSDPRQSSQYKYPAGSTPQGSQYHGGSHGTHNPPNPSPSESNYSGSTLTYPLGYDDSPADSQVQYDQEGRPYDRDNEFDTL